jgi:hypothetical protein
VKALEIRGFRRSSGGTQLTRVAQWANTQPGSRGLDGLDHRDAGSELRLGEDAGVALEADASYPIMGSVILARGRQGSACSSIWAIMRT